MRTYRRRDRHPARRRGRDGAGRSAPAAPAPVVPGADVVLAGFFSAKEKAFAALMAEVSAEVEARGGRVVGHVVQRRGVSAGGVRKMALPYSPRTLTGSGKVRESAALAARTDADAVVFLNPLTPLQQDVLSGIFGRPALGLAEFLSGPDSRPPI
ncbi:hypothetical protein [Streptomyces sp. NPDC058613]|uniref:HflX-like GTP-binding protein n=1 Tax=unclassified Streptomyces TaxID=2593676 RepID=UPI00364F2544